MVKYTEVHFLRTLSPLKGIIWVVDNWLESTCNTSFNNILYTPEITVQL